MGFKKTYNIVKALLEQDQKYRDNDELLVVKIWHEQMKEKGVKSKDVTAFDFFIRYKDQQFITADVITRARRKVMEHHPELRGLSYKPRQKKQDQYKEEIKRCAA